MTTAAPTPTLPPEVAPLADAVTFAVWVATASNLPVRTSGLLPFPTEALVVTLEIVVATLAPRVNPPLPPSAPPSAAVVISSPPVAASFRSWTPVRIESSSRLARVTSSATFTATEPPIPMFDGVVWSAFASAVLV